jgi:hypothetical protein
MLPLAQRHYTLRQLEKRWCICYHTLRRWFMRRWETKKDVINAGNRKNICLRIPESVAEDEYRLRLGRGA